ncbi:MAG: hypothetical protein OXD50_06570 [Chloroflexi bacterium]|nr:hypothetical protein [Chloroflexota bacterium]
MTTQAYHEASMNLLAQADAELAAGDVRQASEKGCGAAAQVVKAVAEQRGWPHQSHSSLYRGDERLTAESGDDSLSDLFHVANALHQNYYENWDKAENVGRALNAMRRFVEKLSVHF